MSRYLNKKETEEKENRENNDQASKSGGLLLWKPPEVLFKSL